MAAILWLLGAPEFVRSYDMATHKTILGQAGRALSDFRSELGISSFGRAVVAPLHRSKIFIARDNSKTRPFQTMDRFSVRNRERATPSPFNERITASGSESCSRVGAGGASPRSIQIAF